MSKPTRCTAIVYKKDGALRYRVNRVRCANVTTRESGRCYLHDGHTTDPERFPLKENKK